jgi:hypothetical protein
MKWRRSKAAVMKYRESENNIENNHQPSMKKRKRWRNENVESSAAIMAASVSANNGGIKKMLMNENITAKYHRNHAMKWQWLNSACGDKPMKAESLNVAIMA